MAIGKDVSGLQETIGYKFRDIKYLSVAITHSSYSNELKIKGFRTDSNQRLEFLGDAVLQTVISELLYKNYPDCDEGRLTEYRSRIVCERSLGKAASRISLSDYLALGNGEEPGGRQKVSITADAFEALIGAVYLDSGEEGLQAVSSLVTRLMSEEIGDCCKIGISDYVTELTKLVEKDGAEQLSFVTAEEGPDNDKKFTVSAMLNSNVIGTGVGRSKSEAKSAAAKEALRLFGVV